jgi:hypothetical protein
MSKPLLKFLGGDVDLAKYLLFQALGLQIDFFQAGLKTGQVLRIPFQHISKPLSNIHHLFVFNPFISIVDQRYLGHSPWIMGVRIKADMLSYDIRHRGIAQSGE